MNFNNKTLTDRCITLAGELQSLAIKPLMLKKQPDIVTTVRKMRKYIGYFILRNAVVIGWNGAHPDDSGKLFTVP